MSLTDDFLPRDMNEYEPPRRADSGGFVGPGLSASGEALPARPRPSPKAESVSRTGVATPGPSAAGASGVSLPRHVVADRGLLQD